MPPSRSRTTARFSTTFVLAVVLGARFLAGESSATDLPSVTLAPVGLALRLRVSGAPDFLYGIESSPDLRSWLNFDTRRTDPSGAFEADVTPDSRLRFFRIRPPAPGESEADPAAVALGERLFLETRFAQFFQAHSTGDVNAPLVSGDPALAQTITLGPPQPGPFAGQSMNCRACHLVDEHHDTLGNRTYADFAPRSPVPDRGDGLQTTARNSPALVNASLPRHGQFFFHLDGEFPDAPSLIEATFTGRNFGWLPGERSTAVAHIARVVREDDGSGPLAQSGGGPYKKVLTGTDTTLPVSLRLPAEFRLNPDTASDSEILAAIARLVTAYLQQLEFQRDADGAFSGSPYDAFLQKNALPRQPSPGESDGRYSVRLRTLIGSLASPAFITPADGSFQQHSQDFRFGPSELAGLKTFLAIPDTAPPGGGHLGNCVACHSAPAFTNFSFHNTGAAQLEYDGIHSAGSFASLAIPALAERTAQPAQYLPPSGLYPTGTGKYLSPASPAKPGFTDLGLWNVFANPAVPDVQTSLHTHLRGALGNQSDSRLLPLTIGLFKTPGLRDLGHSAPYLHNGSQPTLSAVLDFYVEASDLARAGQLRNADPEIAKISLTPGDLAPLADFLRALNEDYD